MKGDEVGRKRCKGQGRKAARASKSKRRKKRETVVFDFISRDLRQKRRESKYSSYTKTEEQEKDAKG